jgi:hypothetical protein
MGFPEEEKAFCSKRIFVSIATEEKMDIGA